VSESEVDDWKIWTNKQEVIGKDGKNTYWVGEEDLQTQGRTEESPIQITEEGQVTRQQHQEAEEDADQSEESMEEQLWGLGLNSQTEIIGEDGARDPSDWDEEDHQPEYRFEVELRASKIP